MGITRRQCIKGAGALPFINIALANTGDNSASKAPLSLPDKSSFETMGTTYLNSGSQHPISLKSSRAAENYLAKRRLDPSINIQKSPQENPIKKFARLINADDDEITYVQSTTTGEQMVLKTLGIPESGGHIVTDTLHFFGSLPLYEEMDRLGMDVTWVRDRDGRIHIEDIKKAVRKGTKLIALSLVSTINGFQHDLKAVCDIAHANGALVYADIIHAAGCVPIDVKASGVDFAACASYKWLMGDFGLGFLYVKKDIQPRLKRTNFGYYGMDAFQSHIYPLDPPGDSIVDYGFANSARGHFALGTYSHATEVILGKSLDYILDLGVENIQSHAQGLTDHLKKELTALGYRLHTPLESKTPLVTCILADARQKLGPRLEKAKIKITLSRNSFRITPSVFNDMINIDKFLAVLGRAN